MFINYRSLLSLFPAKIANSIFARAFNKIHFYPNSSYFKSAPLKYAPEHTMNLHHSDAGHRYIAFTGAYELELTKYIHRIASQQGGLLIDVGANYGYYSLLWSQFFSNKSFAFEASPRNYCPLIENIRLNKLEDRVDTFPYAVCDREGTLTFDLGPEEQTGWGGLNHLSKVESQNEIVQVPAITLDDFVKDKNIEFIRVLKIDTEGSDTLVLQGAKQLLMSQKVEHVFWEQNRFRMKQLGIDEAQSIELLKEAGYTIKEFSPSEMYAFITK